MRPDQDPDGEFDAAAGTARKAVTSMEGTFGEASPRASTAYGTLASVLKCARPLRSMYNLFGSTPFFAYRSTVLSPRTNREAKSNSNMTAGHFNAHTLCVCTPHTRLWRIWQGKVQDQPSNNECFGGSFQCWVVLRSTGVRTQVLHSHVLTANSGFHALAI